MRAIAAAALTAGLLATGALAQSGIGGIIQKSGLSPDDLKLMNQTARTLYDTGAPKVDATASWKNPDSQSSGTSKLLEAKNNCVVLQHVTHPGGQDAPFEIRNRLCRSDDGKWVLQP